MVSQVVVDAKETEAVMVDLAQMACLAVQGLRVFLVQADSLDCVEDLERMACLVYQGQTAHLVIRAEMEVEVLQECLA